MFVSKLRIGSGTVNASARRRIRFCRACYSKFQCISPNSLLPAAAPPKPRLDDYEVPPDELRSDMTRNQIVEVLRHLPLKQRNAVAWAAIDKKERFSDENTSSWL
jgi:hypothetical protein